MRYQPLEPCSKDSYIPPTWQSEQLEIVASEQTARAIGVEITYDYGNQRMSWLCNLFINWTGDDGFLWKMSGDERTFSMMGDTTVLEGKVMNKYIDEKKFCVDIEAWAKNQIGEVTMPANISKVILPSRENGPVVYPEPDPQLVEEVRKARPLHEMKAEGLI